MSLFVRSGSKRKAIKFSKPSRKALQNDEIESSDEEESSKKNKDAEYLSDDDLEQDEDNVETIQEKRYRLAKEYLSEIEKQELEKHESEEFKNEAIAHRLQDEMLEQAGRLQKKITDQILPVNSENCRFLRGHKLSPTCVVVSNDGKKVVSGSKDGSLIIWDTKTGRRLKVIKGLTKNDSKTLFGHCGHIRSLAISSDDKFLVSGGSDKNIHVWEFDTLKHLKLFTGHRGTVTGLSFRRGQHQLYSCSEDRAVKVWNLDEMGYVDTMYGHQDAILDIDSLSKERAITCGGRDRTVRIWKLVEESQLVFHAHSECGSVECLSLINEDHFVSGADDGSLSIWSVMKKKPVCIERKAHVIPGSNESCWISAVAASKFTDLIASGSQDGFIKLWQCAENYKTLTLLQSIPVAGFVNSICFNSDVSHLICAIGQEHKSGRWWKEKKAKNSILICPLERKL